jgi:hypothetical protein
MYNENPKAAISKQTNIDLKCEKGDLLIINSTLSPGRSFKSISMYISAPFGTFITSSSDMISLSLD